MAKFGAQSLIENLLLLEDDATKERVSYFFKTGKGEYGEGDKFLGIKVPLVRATIKPYIAKILPEEVSELVKSEFHEIRLAGLLLWVNQYKKIKLGSDREMLVKLYLNHTQYVNNWDLVDLSCGDILGAYLLDKPKDILYKLAKSANLWEQRIAMVSTLYFIRKGQFGDALQLSEIFLTHKHDLMHKAAGWCLREIGKKDERVLLSFLDKYAAIMPRTMLRYSLEKLNPAVRAHYMGAKQRLSKD